MKPAWLKIGLLAAVIAALGVAGVFLHGQNQRLLARLEELRRRGQPEAESLHQENERLHALLSRTSAANGAAEAAEAVRTEVERARAEVEKLEKSAELRRQQRAAEMASDEQALANNRDPNTGLARLEYFQNVGRATPRAACQTMVAAALKGDGAILADMLFLPESTRAKSAELIASLPEDSRRNWTPEKLAALYFSALVDDVQAAQIVSETLDDSRRATVVLRIPGVDASKSKLLLQLGTGGWQVVVPDNSIDALRRKIAAAAKN